MTVSVSCDGILMTGGHDVDPVLYLQRRQRKPAEYHAAAVIRWKHICLRKRYRKTSRYLESAGGVQLMNVLLGGTLYQDLPTEHPSKTEHHMASLRQAGT